VATSGAPSHFETPAEYNFFKTMVPMPPACPLFPSDRGPSLRDAGIRDVRITNEAHDFGEDFEMTEMMLSFPQTKLPIKWRFICRYYCQYVVLFKKFFLYLKSTFLV
jgi:hypothetical protein